MARAGPLVKDVVTRGQEPTHGPLYVGLKQFLSLLLESDLTPDGKFESSFSQLMDTTLFEDRDLRLEGTRETRARAVLAFAQFVKHKHNGVRVSALQSATVEKWVLAERSTEIKRLLADAQVILRGVLQGLP